MATLVIAGVAFIAAGCQSSPENYSAEISKETPKSPEPPIKGRNVGHIMTKGATPGTAAPADATAAPPAPAAGN